MYCANYLGAELIHPVSQSVDGEYATEAASALTNDRFLKVLVQPRRFIGLSIRGRYGSTVASSPFPLNRLNERVDLSIALPLSKENGELRLQVGIALAPFTSLEFGQYLF